MRSVTYIGVRPRIAAVFALFLMVAVCARADRILQSTWDSGLDAWTFSGSATGTNSSGFLEIMFPAQAAPEYSYEILTRDLPLGYRPTYLSLDFRAPAFLPSSVRVYLHSSSGRSWYKVFSVSVTNEWLSLYSLVDYGSGWILGPMSTEEEFEIDMNSITRVSLAVVRNGASKMHRFDVDDFVIDAVTSGDAVPEDINGDGIPDWWKVAYGFDPGDPYIAAADPDGDGMTNLEEYIAGMDPRNPASAFVLSIPAQLNDPPGDYITIAWPSAEGRVYQIWKATNLVSGFYLLRDGIRATLPINFYMDEHLEGEDTTFYKVNVSIE